jgi:hypothetical protein
VTNTLCSINSRDFYVVQQTTEEGFQINATNDLEVKPARVQRNIFSVFTARAGIGILGRLIGLGGAEFRLPLLIGAFQFAALEAVILNKAMSLVVVASALPFRATIVPFAEITAHWMRIANLLAGRLAGAWFGAGWATRLKSGTLYRIIAILLMIVAVVLMIGHGASSAGRPLLEGGESNCRGAHCRIRDWCGRLASRGGRRRISDPDNCSPVRLRHQAGWKLIARHEPADYADRLHAVQP